jgi:hypothetical protein
MILGINENNYFQSCHTSRHNTRAGFDSAPILHTQTGCSSLCLEGPPLSSVGADHTNKP